MHPQILMPRPWTRGQIFDGEHAVQRKFSGLAKAPIAQLDDTLHRLQGEGISLCTEHGRRYQRHLARRFGLVPTYYAFGPCDIGGCTNGPLNVLYVNEDRYRRIYQRGISAQQYLGVP